MSIRLPRVIGLSTLCIAVAVSCTPKTSDSAEKKTTLKGPSKTYVCDLEFKSKDFLYAFNYTDASRFPKEVLDKLGSTKGSSLKLSFEEYKKAQLSKIEEMTQVENSGPAPIGPTKVAGGGLYLSDNPWSARDFGTLLTIVKFKPNGKYCSTFSKRDKIRERATNELVKEPEKAILYEFGAHLSKLSIVVRGGDFFGDPEITLVAAGPAFPNSMETNDNKYKIEPAPPVIEENALNGMGVEELTAKIINSWDYAEFCLDKENKKISETQLKGACQPIKVLAQKLNGGFEPLIP